MTFNPRGGRPGTPGAGGVSHGGTRRVKPAGAPGILKFFKTTGAFYFE
jgi:hypothetical protein